MIAVCPQCREMKTGAFFQKAFIGGVEYLTGICKPCKGKPVSQRVINSNAIEVSPELVSFLEEIKMGYIDTLQAYKLVYFYSQYFSSEFFEKEIDEQLYIMRSRLMRMVEKYSHPDCEERLNLKDFIRYKPQDGKFYLRLTGRRSYECFSEEDCYKLYKQLRDSKVNEED